MAILAVPVERKVDFIEQFLITHPSLEREVTWLFNYLLTDKVDLSTIHFVLNGEAYERVVTISVHPDTFTPIVFRNQHYLSTDLADVLHSLTLLNDLPFYIEIQYEGRERDPAYALIYEDEPMDSYEQQLNEKIASEWLQQLTFEQQLNHYHQAIDQALSERDFDMVQSLVELKKELEEGRLT